MRGGYREQDATRSTNPTLLSDLISKSRCLANSVMCSSFPRVSSKSSAVTFNSFSVRSKRSGKPFR